MLLTTFFTINASDISTTTSYVQDLISDAMPLIVLLIGVLIGMGIVERFLHR